MQSLCERCSLLNRQCTFRTRLPRQEPYHRVTVTKGVGVDLVNSDSGDDFINSLTRVISLIKPSSDVNKVELSLVLCDKAFY